jgi:hypothetical protein
MVGGAERLTGRPRRRKPDAIACRSFALAYQLNEFCAWGAAAKRREETRGEPEFFEPNPGEHWK